MKIFLILFFMITSCAKHSLPLTTVDWTANSGTPLSSEVENIQGDAISSINSKYGKVEIQKQSLDGFEVEGSYLKKINDPNGQLVRVQAHYQTKNISTFHKARWGLARKNKLSILKDLMAKNQDLAKKDIQSFNLKLVSEDSALVPRWFLNYFESNGELWQDIFSYDLKRLSKTQLGSQMAVTPAWVYPKGPKHGDLIQVYLQNLSYGDGLMSKILKVSSADNTKIHVSGEPLQFGTNDNRFDQVQSFYLSQKTLGWFEKTFSIQYFDALDLQINVGAPEKTNTAFYYQGHVRLGMGDDMIYSKIPWDPSIVTHESAHFVIDMLAHLPFQGQGGSINEAFADYFAASILDNPVLGEASYLPAPFKRRIDLMKKYSEITGGLYGDSVIVSSLLWELNQKLGLGKGLMLAFKTLQNLNPQSSFKSFNRELLKQAELTFEGPEQLKVSNVLIERGWDTK